MRPIKFRAWDRDTKTIQIVTLDDFCNNRYFLPHWKVRVDFDQFTGLHDKNGREIYEGDIVKDSKGRALEVFWTTLGCGRWWFAEDKSHVVEIDTGMNGDGLEVIGNIHENPELLK